MIPDKENNGERKFRCSNTELSVIHIPQNPRKLTRKKEEEKTKTDLFADFREAKRVWEMLSASRPDNWKKEIPHVAIILLIF